MSGNIPANPLTPPSDKVLATIFATCQLCCWWTSWDTYAQLTLTCTVPHWRACERSRPS